MKLNLATEIAPILTIFFQISLESDVLCHNILACVSRGYG
jgi:hypothetical protein